MVDSISTVTVIIITNSNFIIIFIIIITIIIPSKENSPTHPERSRSEISCEERGRQASEDSEIVFEYIVLFIPIFGEESVSECVE